MRDKDAHLIFESYRNRVILNEVAKAVGVPAAEGIKAFISWIAGTAVGAVVVDQAIKALEKIPEFKRNRIESKINETNRILSLNPEEIRSHYETINAIKKEGNSTLSSIAEKFKQPVDIFRSAQDNVDITVDTYYAVLVTSIAAYEELLNSQDAINREIDQVISQVGIGEVRIEEIKAETKVKLAEAKNRKLELENEKLRLENERQNGGGGGGGGGKDPKKKGGIIAGITGGINILALILRVLSKNYQTLKSLFAFAVILAPGFGIFLIKILFSSGKEYARAGQEFADEFKQEIEKPKAQPSPTPIQGEFPTTGTWTPRKKTEPTPQKEQKSPQKEEKNKSMFDYENFIK